MRHENNGKCAKCEFMIYEQGAQADLLNWFQDLQSSTPDVHVSTAYRGKNEQDRCKRDGVSNALFGQSPHNYMPPMAIDLFFLIDGQANFTVNRYKQIASTLPTTLEWGGNWQSLKDLPHYQVVGWKNKVKGYPNGNKP